METFLQAVLALIMFSVGLSLRIQHFTYVLQNRRLLLLGLAAKLLLIPALTFALLSLTTLSPSWQMGIMLLLFCPGGTTSNVITYWTGGTSALTIFLTVLSGFLTIFTLPILVNAVSLFYFGEGNGLQLPIFSTIANIILIIMLPASLGLWLNENRPDMARQSERWIKPASVILLGLVYVIKFLTPSEAGGSTALSWQEVKLLLPPLLLINIGGMTLATIFADRLGERARDARTIGIEMGIQNSGMAILIADVFLGHPQLSIPALIYALFTFWTTLGFGFVTREWESGRFRYRNRRSKT